MALHYSSRLDCEDTVDCMGNLLPGGLQELSIHAIPLYLMVQRDVSSRILRRTNNNDEILTKLTASSMLYFLRLTLPFDLVEAHDVDAEVEDSFDDIGICAEWNERELIL